MQLYSSFFKTASLPSLRFGSQFKPAEPEQVIGQDEFYWTTIRPEGSSFDYQITNRDKAYLRQQAGYPDHWMDGKSMKGLKVVDLCCGGGKFVTELREDLKLPDTDDSIVGVDVSNTQAHNLNPKVYIRKNARELPFADESIDLMYSAVGPFTHPRENVTVQIDILKEVNRVLKKGGKLRLGDVQPDCINALLAKVSGNRLVMTDRTPDYFREEREPKYAELTKQ